MSPISATSTALRDLTRTRTAITRERVREVQRLEEVLEDTGIKLSVVVSDITGRTGRRAILAALIAGERDPAVLADLSVRTLRAAIPALTQALAGRFTDHHAFLVATHLRLIDGHDVAIASVTARIEELMAPFQAARQLITSIPGIGVPTADVIIAETGADMAQFPPRVSWPPGPVSARTYEDHEHTGSWFRALSSEDAGGRGGRRVSTARRPPGCGGVRR